MVWFDPTPEDMAMFELFGQRPRNRHERRAAKGERAASLRLVSLLTKYSAEELEKEPPITLEDKRAHVADLSRLLADIEALLSALPSELASTANEALVALRAATAAYDRWLSE